MRAITLSAFGRIEVGGSPCAEQQDSGANYHSAC